MDITIQDTKYLGSDTEKLNKMFEELEFYSFLKKNEVKETSKINVKIIKDIKDIKINDKCAVYLEMDNDNYQVDYWIRLSP